MRITAKVINEKVKHGWTADDFAQTLNITPEEFWLRLEKQFSAKSYKNFKSDIEANAKLRKRHKVHEENSESAESHSTAESYIEEDILVDYSTQDTSSIVDSAIADLTATNSDSTDSTINTSASSATSTDSDSSVDCSLSLDELHQKLQEILEQINENELEHKAIASKRIEIRNQIKDHADALIKIKSIIAQHECEIDSLLYALDTTKTQMSEVTNKLQILHSQKNDLEADIEKAKKVCIFVYATGVFEFDVQHTFEIPDGNDLFNAIVGDEEIESLTIKETKSLATVIEFVRSLITNNTPYEVYFENEVAEGYFKKVIGESFPV